jgi:uncharacterized protein (DUF3084 family)
MAVEFMIYALPFMISEVRGAESGVRSGGRCDHRQTGIRVNQTKSDQIRPLKQNKARREGVKGPSGLALSVPHAGDGEGLGVGGSYSDFTKQTQFFCKKPNEMASVSKKTNPFQSQSKPI